MDKSKVTIISIIASIFIAIIALIASYIFSSAEPTEYSTEFTSPALESTQ